uniref:Uncharacterized protein n=1 Tax=Globodera rostochiensis TaxID=31243 RepID=A0A914HCP2_GLORO
MNGEIALAKELEEERKAARLSLGEAGEGLPHGNSHLDFMEKAERMRCNCITQWAQWAQLRCDAKPGPLHFSQDYSGLSLQTGPSHPIARFYVMAGGSITQRQVKLEPQPVDGSTIPLSCGHSNG